MFCKEELDKHLLKFEELMFQLTMTQIRRLTFRGFVKYVKRKERRFSAWNAIDGFKEHLLM